MPPNTLTEAERNALFAAALDDQELFNALQDEQTLKELLEDPISRRQIQQAVQETAAAGQKAAWWSQRWAWSSLAVRWRHRC